MKKDISIYTDADCGFVANTVSNLQDIVCECFVPVHCCRSDHFSICEKFIVTTRNISKSAILHLRMKINWIIPTAILCVKFQV